MKIEFENGLINFKILFLKAEKVLESIIFKSKLFHSIIVDGKEEFIKKLVLVFYVLLTLGSVLKIYSGD